MFLYPGHGTYSSRVVLHSKGRPPKTILRTQWLNLPKNVPQGRNFLAFRNILVALLHSAASSTRETLLSCPKSKNHQEPPTQNFYISTPGIYR